jgi:catechol 2,3-dioxygenase-like lactoylglutathione lyase family enzyme
MVHTMNHIGLGVENLEKSVEFYTNVMGMEVDYYAHHEGKPISDVVGVANSVIEICVVKKGEARLELIEYNNRVPAPKQYKPQNEPGLVHISFSVSSVDEEYAKIKALGYEAYSDPMVTRENGPKICYVKGPDNVIFELYEKK